jgi:hypothetical protein
MVLAVPNPHPADAAILEAAIGQAVRSGIVAIRIRM